MNRLVFVYGAMDSGKSLSLLTKAYQAEKSGKTVKVFTSKDRSGSPKVSSRAGLSRLCDEYSEYTNFHDVWETDDARTNELYIDESQFLTASQVDQLSEIASQDRSVFCYGLLTDFRSELFPGSRRLVEMADEIVQLQNHALCWCGNEGRFNTRVVGGKAVYDGPQILVGDVDTHVGYVVLCRSHYLSGEVA